MNPYILFHDNNILKTGVNRNKIKCRKYQRIHDALSVSEERFLSSSGGKRHASPFENEAEYYSRFQSGSMSCLRLGQERFFRNALCITYFYDV